MRGRSGGLRPKKGDGWLGILLVQAGWDGNVGPAHFCNAGSGRGEATAGAVAPNFLLRID
jgi:hypothetical protein